MQDLTLFLSHHLALSLAAIVIFILLMIVEAMRAKRSRTGITPAELTQLINHQQAVVFDIRPQDAYRQGHIIDSQAVTAQELQKPSKKMERFKSKPLVIVCNTGMESQKIATLLLKQGYNAFSLSGGIRAWIQANMPLVKE